jgi:hypothetical protein
LPCLAFDKFFLCLHHFQFDIAKLRTHHSYHYSYHWISRRKIAHHGYHM